MAIPKGTPETYRQRIIEHSEPITESGCWIWMQCLTTTGYGRMTAFGRQGTKAHRISYEVFVGPIPKGMHICHKCDVRECVNPAHLFIGSQKDNITDMMNKGRHKAQVGEECHKAILSERDVKEIRARYIPWKVSKRALAREYGVGHTTIQHIIERKTWRHLA